MSLFIHDPVHESERDVMDDISYFEGFELPNSPPETPPMKSDGVMTKTPMHITLENIFPRTPPHTPRLGLKRSFSASKGGFSSFGPLTPPATPPTRFSGLSRTISDKVLENQITEVSFLFLSTMHSAALTNPKVQEQTYRCDHRRYQQPFALPPWHLKPSVQLLELLSSLSNFRDINWV